MLLSLIVYVSFPHKTESFKLGILVTHPYVPSIQHKPHHRVILSIFTIFNQRPYIGPSSPCLSEPQSGP